MPEDIDPTQQPQDFMPIKKPNFWHRFLFWLSGLTPKHKAVLAVILVLAVAIIGAVIYFVFAMNQVVYRFVPYNNNWTAGSQQMVLIEIDNTYLDQEVVVLEAAIKVDASWLTSGDLVALGLDTNSVSVFAGPNFREISSGVETDPTNNYIYYHIEGYNSATGQMAPLIDPTTNQVPFLELQVDLSSAPVGGTVTFTFENLSSPLYTNFAAIRPVGGGSTLGPASLVFENSPLVKLIKESEAHTIYLKPDNANGFNGSQQTLYVGDVFDVDIWLEPSQDLVAVAVDVNYDTDVLYLDEVIKSEDFPVRVVCDDCDVEKNNHDGIYKLARGYYGNGLSNDGNMNQTVKVATLKFKAVGLINNSETFTDITLTNKQGVVDDGQGTSVNLSSAAIPPNPDGQYKVNAFAAKVIITKGPEVHVKKVNDKWQAEVYWETNVDADANVNYGQTYLPNTTTFPDTATDPISLLRKQHLVTLKNLPDGLIDGATYYYQIISKDAKNNEVQDKIDGTALKNHHQFVVEEVLSDLTIKNLSARASYNSATISWNTVGGESNGLANSQIDYCETGGVRISKSWDDNADNYSLSHSIAVSGLNNDTTYTCEVKSTDKDGKVAICKDEGEDCKVTFTTKAGQAFDANVVLKVMPDRICDKWLYCRSAVEVVNSKDEKESLCFDIGLCNEQNGDGECVSTNNLTSLGIRAAEQTFKHPINVSQIQNLSGYSKVGLDWGAGKIIAGNYHVGVMEPVGADINLVNGDFETGEAWPWVAASNAELSVIYKNDSRVLKIKPQIPTGANKWLSAEAPLGFISREPGYDYAISMNIWSASSISRDVDIELKVASAYYTVAKVTITSASQTIVLTSNQKNSQFAYPQAPYGPQSGQGALAIGDEYIDTKAGYFGDDIYVDNISLKSVLPINGLEKIARSCRLYPSVGAIACDTVDANGKVQRGWRGFCLEQDSKYPTSDQEKKMCLNWWPVDIIPGETDIFGKDNQAGYMGRQPLYYCMESAGNYPYIKVTRTGGRSLFYQYCDKNNVAEMLIGGYIFGPIGAFIGAEIPNGKEICGWAQASGRQTMRAPDEIGLRDIDMERIVLQPLCEGGEGDKHCFSKKENSEAVLVLSRANDWQDFLCIGSNCQGDEYYKTSGNLWGAGRNMINNNEKCGKQGVDFFAIRAVFENGEFVGLETGLCNNGVEQGFVRYKSIFYLRESCNVIAQVVTPDSENMAWASKIKRGGWLKDSSDNYLGYEYGADYEPYGAAVVGAPASDPTEWFNPLYVMPLDDALGYEAPYQVRAGTPYGVIGSVGQEKIGKTQCISGDAENLGRACSSSFNCGFSVTSGQKGLCMGVNLSKQAMANIYGGYDKAKTNLQNLFAKSYRVWKWAKKTDGSLGYVEVGLSQNFGWDISPEAKYVDTRPRIFNVKVKGQAGGPGVIVDITGPKRVKLEFNSQVNADHLPLTAFRVYWGDNTPISQVNNLKIEARTDPANPHVLFHTYECNPAKMNYDSNGDGINDSCRYIPKIQVEDNWGWCNNGVTGDKCPDRSDTAHPWQPFKGSVIVN